MTKTIAQQAAEALRNDGTNWTTDDDESFADLMARLGAERDHGVAILDDEGEKVLDEYSQPTYRSGASSEHFSDAPIRHVFPDGSAIVEAGAAWDIEGEKPFSWASA